MLAFRQLRLLLKQRRPDEHTSLQSLFSALPHGGDTPHRRLLQAAGATGIQIQSLGKYSGVSMVEIPEGVSKAELLQLLQDHPGESCSSPCACAHRKRQLPYWTS